MKKKIFNVVLLINLILICAICFAQSNYIGNSNTHKFHSAGCYMIDKMNPLHKVPFNNREEAINQGYIPCKKCNP